MGGPLKLPRTTLVTLTLLLSGMMVFSLDMPDASEPEVPSAISRFSAPVVSLMGAGMASGYVSDAASGAMSGAATSSAAGSATGITSGPAPGTAAGPAPVNVQDTVPHAQGESAVIIPEGAQPLSPPTILAPSEGTQVGIRDRIIRWRASPDAVSYRVVLTDTDRWTKVYAKDGIRDTQLSLESGMLHFGGRFTLTIQAVSGLRESEAARVNFRVHALHLPVITTPEPDAALPLDDVVLAWEPIQGITRWHVVVKDKTTWRTLADRPVRGEPRIVLPRKLFAIGGTYRLYIHPTLDGEDGAPSHVDIHTQRLSSPHILTPSGTNAVPAADTPVAWEPVVMTETYRLVLTIPDTGDVAYEDPHVRDTHAVIPGNRLIPGISYRLYVFACAGGNESVPSHADLKVAPLPTPVLTTPLQDASVSSDVLRVAWNPVAQAERYKVVVTDTVAWQPVHTTTDITESECLLDSSFFPLGGHFRIYVHAIGHNAESPPGYVDVHTPTLEAPFILSPQHAIELPPGDVTVSWKPVPEADQYRVAITDTATWEILQIRDIITETTCRFDGSLLSAGGSYRIYVTTLNGTGESAPSIVDIRLAP